MWEDFQPGEVIYHPFGRTVTRADNQMFTLMTQNIAKIHLDAGNRKHDAILVLA